MQGPTNENEQLSLRAVVRAGASYLAEVVSKIVRKIAGVAPLLVTLSCESTHVEKAPPPAAVVEHAPAPTQETDEPKPLGQFSITFYYVIGEDEVIAKSKTPPPANDNDTTLASITPDLVTLYEPKRCSAIADVSPEFASQLQLQGTGKLHDGRVLNVAGRCKCGHSPCFNVTPTQWGTAGTGKPLQPFRTVAVDPKVVKLGSLLYVPLLEGRTMPGRPPWGGYVHDGCVVADDVGGGIDGNQLDLFVGRKAYFLGMSGSGGRHAWARHVPVFDGSKICERKGRVVAKKAGAI
ncbi:MAG TPA: 3D domain-containing protein [Kofleriaceae bacterium]|nr:3D domain-containing protein [Kofleriaceae bacterium]